jgi:1,4-dihydroxy-2-naphthoyl-CoA hydrolase
MSNLTPKIRAMLNSEKSTVLRTLDVELTKIDEEHALLTMPISKKVCQPAGLLHGGINMFLAETAASMHCAFLVNLKEIYPVGLEINGSHLSSASNGTVQAEARILNRGRTIIVHKVDITLVEEGRLLTTTRVTNYLKRVINSS